LNYGTIGHLVAEEGKNNYSFLSIHTLSF